MNIYFKTSDIFERAMPIVIMAALAMTSISLLKSAPTYSVVVAPRPQAQYDYYLRQFSTAQINDQGKLKSFIRGRYAEHSTIANNTSVDDFLFASSSKNNSYLGQADFADVNDNANDLILKQNAVVNRKSLIQQTGVVTSKLKSNHLKLSQYPESVISESIVLIEQDGRTMSAKFMHYDADNQQTNLHGAIKIKNEPKVK